MLWDGHERIKAGYRHGLAGTPAYKAWCGMKDRCTNQNNPRWSDYGGRGITFDPKWASFEGFYADMGERPQGKTLDRFPDPHGNYTKENCRWATPKEQQNNLRNNRIIKRYGQTKTIAQWAAHLNINSSTLRKRLDRGWTVTEAFKKPPTKTTRTAWRKESYKWDEAKDEKK